MLDLKEYIKNKITTEIEKWNEEGIYAISLFIYSNEYYKFNGIKNVTELKISYNTVNDLEDPNDKYSEERWNYAFWRQNEVSIFAANDRKSMEVLFKWYKENNIENIGFEDEQTMYDKDSMYVGKGPIGLFELLQEVSEVAKELQNSGYIKSIFKKEIPIIIHDLEYTWYTIKATENANQNGEINDFLKYLKDEGLIY